MRECAQPSSWRAKEENKGHWEVPLLGVRVKKTSKKHKGISLVHLNTSRSQSGKGKKGNLWQGHLYHTAIPGYLGRVLTACGDVEVVGKYCFKIYTIYIYYILNTQTYTYIYIYLISSISLDKPDWHTVFTIIVWNSH